ncbi:MAG: hypothetical protein R3B47_00515 [Bacteroidia bacterium]
MAELQLKNTGGGVSVASGSALSSCPAFIAGLTKKTWSKLPKICNAHSRKGNCKLPELHMKLSDVEYQGDGTKAIF